MRQSNSKSVSSSPSLTILQAEALEKLIPQKKLRKKGSRHNRETRLPLLVALRASGATMSTKDLGIMNDRLTLLPTIILPIL